MRAHLLSVRRVLLALALTALLVMAGAAAFVAAGVYDVSSTSGHTQVVHTLMEVAMRRSVQVRAASLTPPPLGSPLLQARGAACFRDHCVQCHGAPGMAPGAVGLSLQPLPGPLVDAAQRWGPGELYWITRHGIKMSGMPAWGVRLHDDDLWALVAFMQRLPQLSPRDYRQTVADTAGQACRAVSPPPMTAGASPSDPVASARPGRQTHAPPALPVAVLFRQYACTACHVVPGVESSDPQIGPPLHRFGRRTLVAGRLPMTEEALARWIRFPRQVDPETAMPEVGVTEADARAMAAFLMRQR